jgi:hypothetical protein
VKVTSDWKIRADKPLLRYLSLLPKPVSMNHEWAMAQVEKTLKAQLTVTKRSVLEATRSTRLGPHFHACFAHFSI